MADDIIYDTSFFETLKLAVRDFEKALTKRWREDVREKILDLSYEFRSAYRRSSSPREGSTWAYYTTEARHHFVNGGCAYMDWVEGGQNGDLGSVSCPGDTGVTEPTDVMEMNGNGMVTLPPKIECGMGTVFERVETWAAGEGAAILYELPAFDAHDQKAIESAQNALLKIGGNLGLTADGTSDSNFDLGAASNADLLGDARKLIGNDGEDALWYQHWTGTAANSLKDGFFASIGPTFHNQSKIAGCISNLYAARGTIIQQGRAGNLELLNEATKALDATQEVTTDLNGVWQTFQGVGTALTIPGAFFPPVGAVGASIVTIGIAGSNFLPETKSVEYTHEIEAIMEKIWEHIDGHKSDIFSLENDYNNGVHSLRNAIFEIHSFNLELYDITQNDAEGNGDKQDRYGVQVDEILEIADTCFEAAEAYEDTLMPLLNDVRDADSSLAGKDGTEDFADPKVKDLVEEFHGFLRTSCGRLYEAGEQIKAAAEAYAEVDDSQKGIFDATMENWDEGSAPSQSGDWAQATDRSGWEVPIPGAPPYVTDTTPGGGDTGDIEYETELNK